MGGGVGLTIGFIFGSYSILRYNNTLITLKLKTMNNLSKGGSRTSRIPCHTLPVHAQQRGNVLIFPCNWIGERTSITACDLATYHLYVDWQVIRSDTLVPPHVEAARLQLLSPIIRTKADGVALMRARWDAERRLRELRKCQ